MAGVFFMTTLILYLISTGLALGYLVRRSEALPRAVLWVTGVGFVTHTVALVGRTVALSQVPMTSFHEALSFFSWTLVLVFLLVDFRHRVHVLGAFILPLASLSLLSAAALPKGDPTLQPVLGTVWVHVILSILGTAGFAVAFAAGIMYLIQDGLLKSKKFNVLYSKLPPLDFLDNLNQQAIVMGFPFLTLGIIMGAISAEFTRGSYLNWNPEQTWALVTWVFYFVVLIGRLTVGWRAKRAAYLTIIGFAGVVLTFVGVILKGPLA